MAFMINDTYTCKCGHTFEWEVCVKKPGDIVVYWVNRANAHASLVDICPDKYIVSISCPECRDTEIIEKAK